MRSDYDAKGLEKKKPGVHYAWVIFVGCCFMQAGGLGAVLDACGVFFVPVCTEMGFTRAELSSYLSAYFLAKIIAMFYVGSVLPKVNIRVLLSTMFILVCLAIAAMGFYREPWQWWISGLIFGFAGSFIFVIPVPILIGNWFHKRTGITMGIAMAFSGIGAAIFAPLFTWIISEVGWRNAYFIVAAILAAVVLPWTMFVFRFKPEDMGLKPYGYVEGHTEATGSKITVSEAGVPVLKALKSSAFWVCFVLTGMIAFFAGFNSFLPGFAESIGFSAMFGATLLTAVSLGNITDKILMGWLNDILGVQFTFVAQFIMVGIGLALFIFVREPWLIYVAAFFFGVQNSLVSVSTPLLLRQIFGTKDFPRIFSYARIGTGVFGFFGAPVIGGLFDMTGSFNPGFAVGIVICLIGCALVPIAYSCRKKLIWEDRDHESSPVIRSSRVETTAV